MFQLRREKKKKKQATHPAKSKKSASEFDEWRGGRATIWESVRSKECINQLMLPLPWRSRENSLIRKKRIPHGAPGIFFSPHFFIFYPLSESVSGWRLELWCLREMTVRDYWPVQQLRWKRRLSGEFFCLLREVSNKLYFWKSIVSHFSTRFFKESASVSLRLFWF